MTDPSSTNLPPLPNLHTITDRQTHDAAISLAQGTFPNYTDAHPTLIYVSSASYPPCRAALPKVIQLAESNPQVAVYVLELTPETTPMIKFGMQNCPVYIMMRGGWCETVLGHGWKRVVEAVGEKMES